MRDVAAPLPDDDSELLSPGAVQVGGDGRPHLIGGCCSDCGVKMFPRAPVCPSCMSEDVVEEGMPDRGILYSFSVVHVGRGKWTLPFAIGYVDLPNGVRVFAHLKGQPAIGEHVTVAVDTIGHGSDGRPLTNFVFTTERVT